MQKIWRWLRHWPLSPASTHAEGRRSAPAAGRLSIRIYW